MKNKSKKKLNIIDLIIIIFLVGAIALAGFFFIKSKTQNNPVGSAVYADFTIDIPVLKESYKSLIKVGDPVIETVRHTPLGQVVNVVYNDAKIVTTDTQESGKMQEALYPDHVNLKVTIRGPFEINQNGEYSVAGSSVVVGSLINFSTPNFINSGYCISIDHLTDQQSQKWEQQLKSQQQSQGGSN